MGLPTKSRYNVLYTSDDDSSLSNQPSDCSQSLNAEDTSASSDRSLHGGIFEGLKLEMNVSYLFNVSPLLEL